MRKELIDNNPLLKLSIASSLQIIDYCELLNSDKKFILAKQLLRSATSIGANAMEAQNPESKADFIHKIKLQPKRPMKHSTGLYFVNKLQIIHQ